MQINILIKKNKKKRLHLCQVPSNDLFFSFLQQQSALWDNPCQCETFSRWAEQLKLHCIFACTLYPTAPTVTTTILAPFSHTHTVSWVDRVDLRQCSACVLMQATEH